jgi:glutamate N-acetyltransferase / amino-acid N-acetyltransferase
MAKAPATVSPFAPKSMPTVPAIDGVRFATAEAGIRYKGRTDLLLVALDPGTVAAGVTTKSKTCSSAVLWCREALKTGTARAVVVNSGNANTFTGKKGADAVRITADAAAKATGGKPDEIYIASTGVIGEPMDASKFAHLLDGMAKSAKPDAWDAAARAIMTTDTYPKLAVRSVQMGKTMVTLAGFCKGAGMIAPDMATMLGFMFTDAAISQPVLQTGAAAKRGAPAIKDAADPDLIAFADALLSLMLELAHMVARDGEGLTKFVTIEVLGAENDAAARKIAFSIANSPIMKTAIAGEDPNWGRVVMAVGKSGELADRDKLSIWFGPHLVAREGERASTYVEATAAAYMKNAELTIRVDVGIAAGRATVWTCDLTHDYVTINSDYRS